MKNGRARRKRAVVWHVGAPAQKAHTSRQNTAGRMRHPGFSTLRVRDSELYFGIGHLPEFRYAKPQTSEGEVCASPAGLVDPLKRTLNQRETFSGIGSLFCGAGKRVVDSPEHWLQGRSPTAFVDRRSTLQMAGHPGSNFRLSILVGGRGEKPWDRT